MNNTKIKIIVAYFFAISWMIVIFLFSNASGSNSGNESKGIIKNVITITDKIVVNLGFKNELSDDLTIDTLAQNLNVPLRKVMHFSEYFILCLLWIWALSLSKVKSKYLIALLICFLYAMSDEFHQTFIDGRSGQPLDVLIDFSGSLFYSTIHYLIMKIKHN